MTNCVREHGCTSVLPGWHEPFLKMLPQIEAQLSMSFRDLRREARAEAVQEGLVNALVAFRRLHEQGRADRAFPSALARFAAAQIRDGRQAATPMNVQDITSRYCHRRKGVQIRRIDRFDPAENCWQEVLIEDRKAGPARMAAMRIDFADFLRSLPRRERKIALKLAAGESTGAVAQMFCVSSARISQLRRELLEKWRAFHDETPALCPAVA